jgi:hypothetical protein
MLTRPIFIRPDSELIRESVCACAKLFVDEENIGPLSTDWVCLLLFIYLLHHVFPILSVILTKYHYIILTDFPGSNFIDIFLKLY